MKNIVLLDKSVFQTNYIWQKDCDVLEIIDREVLTASNKWGYINHIVCYLSRSEFESFKDHLPRDVLVYALAAPIDKSISMMCKRYVQYGGVYFMEDNNG